VIYIRIGWIVLGLVLMFPLVVYRIWTVIYNLDTPGAMFQLLGPMFILGLAVFGVGYICEDGEISKSHNRTPTYKIQEIAKSDRTITEAGDFDE